MNTTRNYIVIIALTLFAIFGYGILVDNQTRNTVSLVLMFLVIGGAAWALNQRENRTRYIRHKKYTKYKGK